MSRSNGALSNTSAHLIAVHLKSANKQIFRALMSIASATLLVRVFGMLNQIIVTQRFGAGAIRDAYFVASALPTLIASLGASAIESSGHSGLCKSASPKRAGFHTFQYTAQSHTSRFRLADGAPIDFSSSDDFHFGPSIGFIRAETCCKPDTVRLPASC